MKLLTHETQWRGGETVIAFGAFDGVHEGHARLMSTARELAQRDGIASVVYTFSSHPMTVFAPEQVPPELQTRSEKVCAIARQGIDVAVLRPFDRDYAAQSPEEFVSAFVDALHPRHVVIGFNFSFGNKGAGKRKIGVIRAISNDSIAALKVRQKVPYQILPTLLCHGSGQSAFSVQH